MTTITMCIDGDQVIAASDRQVTAGEQKFGGLPKVWAAGPVCWGWAGSMLLGSWCRRTPPPAAPDGLEEWADRLRERAAEVGLHADGMMPGEALIGHAGDEPSLYLIGCDGSVIRIERDCYAVGSGSAYAIGAMYYGAGASDAVLVAASNDPGTGCEVVAVVAVPP